VSESGRYAVVGLRRAVLGLVARQPTHGYGLYDQIRRWPLERALIPERTAIYRALTHLADQALVEPLGSAPGNGPEHIIRTTYGITAEGEHRHEEWLRSPPATYEDLCMRIVAARRQDVPLLVGFLTAAEDACLARLQELRMPAVETLDARGAPWEHISTVLLGRMEAAELAGRSKALRDLRRTLAALPVTKPTTGVDRR
jgi:DNA-binding PadR family transcriptional regulator